MGGPRSVPFFARLKGLVTTCLRKMAYEPCNNHQFVLLLITMDFTKCYLLECGCKGF